jgi:pectinesterase
MMKMQSQRALAILLAIFTLSFFALACDGGSSNGGCNSGSSSSSTSSSSSSGSIGADVTVAKDGSGNYTSVQSAINAAPSNRSSWYTIKNGTYKEVVTVPSNKTYLRLLGQSATGTILTYNNYASKVGSTSGSASAFFQAKNFIAKNITFENSFNYPNSSAANRQAVAAEPMADRQVFVNCRFTGYQDTLYVRNASRIYFKDCFIQGHTDFIFGDATAVFDQCEINSRQKNGGCISAPSTPASTPYGLIFLDCDVTAIGSSSGVWLGRPWHPSSSSGNLRSMAVYLYCNLGSHIATNGWTSMSGVYPSTERMYEYSNSGSGAAINSSRRQLSAGQAANYTVSNMLRGSDGWNPESWAAME